MLKIRRSRAAPSGKALCLVITGDKEGDQVIREIKGDGLLPLDIRTSAPVSSTALCATNRRQRRTAEAHAWQSPWLARQTTSASYSRTSRARLGESR